MDSHEEFHVIKVEKMWRFHNLCFAIQVVVLEKAVLQADVSIINVLKDCGGLFLWVYSYVSYIVIHNGRIRSFGSCK